MVTRSIMTCAVIVTEANELVRPIHDRTPVIIAPENYARWWIENSPIVPRSSAC